MGQVKDYKEVGRPFSNARTLVEVEYDFANDDGAVEVKDLLKAKDDLVITDFYIKGKTTFDSAADGASIDVGIKGGDTDALVDGVVEADVAEDAVVYDGTNQIKPLKLAKDAIIAMEILGEALTAGKCVFVFEIAHF